ncbi:ATP-dependent DNA helicase [Fasciola hepatica]|uniref:ATP-dependent DNA helicase n=1 Tax=Fasciola hepatica TaxID=6192 RepID=A0A4E0RHT5_FASHE|nr:ATP-dependent DNA helicase [Fasciola hepatica]
MSTSLRCDLVIEELMGDKCNVERRTSLKDSILALVRDDSTQLLLRVTPLENARSNKTVIRSIGFPVLELTLYKRFIDLGRATIYLPLHPARIMLSNCPPDQLRVFLITLRTKLKEFQISRSKRLSVADGPVTSLSLLEEISPLRFPTRNQPPNAKNQVFLPTKVSQICPKSSSHNTDDFCHPPMDCRPLLISTPVRKAKDHPKAPVGRTFSHIVPSWKRWTPSLSPKGDSRDLQSDVIELVKKGRNVFCTGGAGTGKSYLIRRIIGLLPPDCTAITASTGTAANIVGGITVHAFTGLGSLLSEESSELGENDAKQADKWRETLRRRIQSCPAVVNRWKRIRHLIIDEVSMLSSVTFQRLDMIAKVAILGDVGVDVNEPAFGGIQLIVFGDFYQLPPVTKSPGARFAFETQTWGQCRFSCVELLHSWRQSDDPDLARLLSTVREGYCPDWASRLLKSRFLPSVVSKPTVTDVKSGLIATRLCTHRGDAEAWNLKMLNALKGPPKIYRARDSSGSQSRLLDSVCPVPTTLTLKIGAQVILLRNIDTSKGLVNGARGVVQSFSSDCGLPQVRFFVQRSTEPGAKSKGFLHTVQLDRWNLRGDGGEIVAYRRQLPLNLAWAISIHKSQGITLDTAELALSKVFECGQAYVALSRCRSLNGLFLLDWRPEVIQADPKVKEFYASIRNTCGAQNRSELLDDEQTPPIKRNRIS